MPSDPTWEETTASEPSWEDTSEVQTTPTPIKLSPYQQYRLSGREPVAGPFGPSNPQEVLALPQVLKAPAAAIEATGIPGSVEEIGADFLRRSGINPSAQPGVPLVTPGESTPPSPLEEAFPNVTRGIESGLRKFLTPGGVVMSPLLPLKPVQAAFEAQMLSGVPESTESLIRARSPEEVAEAGIGLAAGLGAGRALLRGRGPKFEETTPIEPTEPTPTPTPEPISEQAPPAVAAGEAQPSAAPGGATVETPVSAGETPQAKAEVSTPEPSTQEGTVTPPVTEPEIVPMGGDVYGANKPPEGTPTSTKNAVVDAERVKRGLPEAIQPARREFGEVWDRAMAKIDQDPEYPDNLIDELDKRPRPATDEENAVLLHRQVDLQNEYAKASRDLAQAFEDGRREAVDSEKVRVSNLLDKLKQVYDVGKKVGTEQGRGLNARKMLANEDFTLGKMTMDMMAAKGGAKLTPDQALEIQKLHDKIKATQDAYDDYVSRSNVKIADLERQLGEQPRFTPPIIKAAERIVSTLDTRANAARQRLKEKMARTSAGVDPTILADLAEIGASHIAHIGLDFAKWSSEMVKELGEWVRPHLDEAYAASQKAIDSIQGVPTVVKEGVKTAFSRLTPEEKVAATVDAIKQRVADKKPDEITFFVQRLARDLVARGVRDRDKLIDQVHEVIKQAIPEFTKRQTMDAISGYGDFKQLSKDEISVALRGMKGEMQQLAKLEDMAKGEPPLKSGTERRTPTEAERALIKEVNEAKFKFQVPVQDPSTQLKSALDTLKTTLTNRIKDYEDRIARGDYSARPKRELVLDPEAARLKAQNERVKKEFQKGVELERFKNAQPFERGAHWINKWRRGFILSSPITLAKLTAAAVQRMAFTPVEEAVGSAYSKAFPRLASLAPREGGFSPSAETLAITRGITEGMRDAWDLIKTGESDLDAMYGKTSALPGSFLDFFGRVHGALKSSTKRAEFTRSMQKRIEFGRRNGIDVTDPWVQMKMGIEAYKDANRSIFMQDNRVVSAYRRFIGALEQKSKVTGQVPASGKAAATAARVLLPIVKVPTNIVAETLQYALGSVSGGVNLAKAYAKGIDQLKPEEADLIMRQLKKGSIGLAVMTLGFLNPNTVGGYYQRGEKRKPGDAGVGSIKVYDHNIPSFLLHNPLLETLQIGATARRVADAHRSRSTEKKGLGEGLYAAAVGLGEEVPFVREMAETTKAFDPTQKNAFWGELGKSLVIPQAVQWIASHYDTDKSGKQIKRSPKTTLEHIETGIPGLREKVPKKKGQ